MEISTFTGGIFDTNTFLLRHAARHILIDAPEGAQEWISGLGVRIDLLLLTHGHIDHVIDAAAIQRIHGCRVGYHADGEAMITQADFFRRFGFELEIEPIKPDLTIDETESVNLGGIDFKVLHVPGHCPGSLCFFDRTSSTLFGGDVLFAGGIGRWDLPGGNRELLLRGIREKLFPLGDDVKVLPGHGPATTIGRERQSNPFLAD